MKLFIDTNYIVSLVNNNDSLHNRAKELKEILTNNNCFISNLIISEIVTVIGNRINTKTAIKTYNTIINLCTILNEYEIKNFNNKVMELYEKYDNKLSFKDCSNIVLMRENNIKRIITFDKEFKRSNEIEIIK